MGQKRCPVCEDNSLGLASRRVGNALGEDLGWHSSLQVRIFRYLSFVFPFAHCRRNGPPRSSKAQHCWHPSLQRISRKASRISLRNARQRSPGTRRRIPMRSRQTRWTSFVQNRRRFTNASAICLARTVRKSAATPYRRSHRWRCGTSSSSQRPAQGLERVAVRAAARDRAFI
jgi:hypothetical protein